MRDRLLALGMEPEAVVFSATDFEPRQLRTILGLWDTEALNAHYRQDRQRLSDWLDRFEALEPDVAAREVYIMGAQAVRSLVFDPWLPAPMIDDSERHAYLETVKRFDETGKALWKRLYQIQIGMPYMNEQHAATGMPS